VPTAAQALRHRRDIADLIRIALRDVGAVFGQVDTAETAREALEDLLPSLVALYGSAAATLSAEWYDEIRDDDEIRGRFAAIPAEIDAAAAGTSELAGWGIAPLFQAEPDWESARTLVEGGLQRRIANASRGTITGSSIADPAADGWQRVGSGECEFCDMLIGRGAVYSEAGADFASHDHCNCTAAPAFGGQPRPVKPYTPSQRNVSDADRARVREYLRTH
jgi:hypothetical protein